MEEAILGEKRLKKWERQWKIELIETHNPYWRDLYSEICGRNEKLEALDSRFRGND